MVGLLHHRPENPLDFIDVCLNRVREIGWKNVRWNTFVEETEGNHTTNLPDAHNSWRSLRRSLGPTTEAEYLRIGLQGHVICCSGR